MTKGVVDVSAVRVLLLGPLLTLFVGCCVTDSRTGVVKCHSCLGHGFGFLMENTPRGMPTAPPFSTTPAPIVQPPTYYGPPPTVGPGPSWSPVSPTPTTNPESLTPIPQRAPTSSLVPSPERQPILVAPQQPVTSPVVPHQPVLAPIAPRQPLLGPIAPTAPVGTPLVVPGVVPQPIEPPVQLQPITPSARTPAPPAVRNRVSWGNTATRRN